MDIVPLFNRNLGGKFRGIKLAEDKQEAAKKPEEENSYDKLKLAGLSLQEVLLLGWVNDSLKET